MTLGLVHLDFVGLVQRGPGRPGMLALKSGMPRNISFDRTRIRIHHLKPLR